MGLQPHLKKEIPTLATSSDFDFLIGSVHVADRLDPYKKDFYEGRTQYQPTIGILKWFWKPENFSCLIPVGILTMWYATALRKTKIILTGLTGIFWTKFSKL